MNREQRRRAQRNQPAYKRLNHDQLMNALVKNGIQPSDIKAAKAEGYQSGVENAFMTCYAAFCLAMDEELHLDSETMLRILKNADRQVVVTLDSYELIDEVFKRFKITLDFKQGIDRVQEVS